MELSIAVVDDSQTDMDILVPQINDLFIKQGISTKLSCFMGGKAFLKENNNFDLIFLDIEMPGMDGLQTAETYWKNHETGLLIFLTSHVEYSRKGYLVRAFRFLDKNLLGDDLEEAITSAIKVIGDFSELTVFDSIGTTVQIEYRKILYIEVMKRKILVHTQDSIISSREKISELEERMDHPDFYRIHRLFMVNMKYVEKCDRQAIFMYDGSVFPISERKTGEFRKVFTKWKFERGNG